MTTEAEGSLEFSGVYACAEPLAAHAETLRRLSIAASDLVLQHQRGRFAGWLDGLAKPAGKMSVSGPNEPVEIKPAPHRLLHLKQESFSLGVFQQSEPGEEMRNCHSDFGWFQTPHMRVILAASQSALDRVRPSFTEVVVDAIGEDVPVVGWLVCGDEPGRFNSTRPPKFDHPETCFAVLIGKPSSGRDPSSLKVVIPAEVPDWNTFVVSSLDLAHITPDA